MRSIRPLLQLCALALLVVPLYAHEGHHTDKIEEGSSMSADPIDARLWTHILLMILSFAILMPIGQVLGLVKSKWHVPCQIIATIIAVVGYFLALTHGGRQFAHPNIHVTFGNSLMLMLAVQVGLGAGLKLHLEQRSGWLGKIFGGKVGTSGRRGVVLVHSLIGKAMPVFAWVQMLFGGIIAMGYCQFNDTLGQCVAHGIMGSAFIAYGIISAILLLVGQAWLRRTGKSQEFFDSAVITLWGCINSLTEHRWGHPWVKNDLQHTSMGVIWTCGGLLSLFLSKSRSGKPRRNLMPSLIIFITGWGMSAHPQELMLSTMVHTVFGFSLMAAAACRGIEIAFVLRDSRGHGEPHSWQHLCPFLLCASGFLFMFATQEQMRDASNADVSHVSYILLVYSIAFLLYLFVNILLHIYAVHTWPDDESNGQIALSRHISRSASVSNFKFGNGHSKRLSTAANGDLSSANGHMHSGSVRVPRQHRPTDSQQVRDAEEFELEGLISEDDESPSTAERRRKEQV